MHKAFLESPYFAIPDSIYRVAHYAQPRPPHDVVHAVDDMYTTNSFFSSMADLKHRAEGSNFARTVLRLTNEVGELMQGELRPLSLLVKQTVESNDVYEWLDGLTVAVATFGREDTTWASGALLTPTPLVTGATLLEIFTQDLPEYLFSPVTAGTYEHYVTYKLRDEFLESLPNTESRYIPERYIHGERVNLDSAYSTSTLYQYIDGDWHQAQELTEPVFSVRIPLSYQQNILPQVRHNRTRRREELLSNIRSAAWVRNQEQERQQEQVRTAAMARYVAYREKQEGKAREDRMVISELPFVAAGKGIKSSRRWGIEVETGAGRDLRGTPRGWASKDDGSLESAYQDYIDPSECPEGDHREEIEVEEVDAPVNIDHGSFWVSNPHFSDPYYCESCGDVEGDYYEDCVELVSPILSSMHSRGLREICEDLEHAPRTESAGVHVHVEASDLTVRQIRELVLAYDHVERFVEASYDRVYRGYCKRRSASEVLEIARRARSVDHVESLYKGDRYVTLNLQALDDRGTVEFRAMGPKYNYDHLIRWAMFCREMVNSIKNGAVSKHFARAKSWNDVLAIFAKYGEEYPKIVSQEIESAEELAEDYAMAV